MMLFLLAVRSLAAEEVDKQIEWFVGCRTQRNSLTRQLQEEAEEGFWSLLAVAVEEGYIQKAYPTVIPVVSVGQSHHPTCRRSTVMHYWHPRDAHSC